MKRMTALLSQTRREAPSDIERPGQQLLVRAGFLQPLGGGISGLLPLGVEALEQLEKSLMNSLQSYAPQPIRLPLVQPGELWESSSLPADHFDTPFRQNLVLAPHSLAGLEEIIRTQVRSYRQLPTLLAQSGSIWQNGPRLKAEIWRGRQTECLDLFSLNSSEAELEETFQAISGILTQFFKTLGLPIQTLEGNFYLQGGGALHGQRWQCALADAENSALVCPACGAAADEDAARFQRSPVQTEAPLELVKTATPHCPTIEALATFLKIPASRTAKAVFMTADAGTRRERLIFAVVRGDREVSLTRLMQAAGAASLRPSEDSEIEAVGAVPGYASPVGLKNVEVIADVEIPTCVNLVSGANEIGYHLLNVNYGRDFTAQTIAEIAAARPGDACAQCGAPLESVAGVWIASAHRIDPETLLAQNCTYMQQNGKPAAVQAAVFSLNLSRILACLAEIHHDTYGLCWPAAAAPHPIHMILIEDKGGVVKSTAEKLAEELEAAGLKVLLDDRSERAGVKFNDADLIGLPVRITVSERALEQGGVEFKLRSAPEKKIVALHLAAAEAAAALQLSPVLES